MLSWLHGPGADFGPRWPPPTSTCPWPPRSISTRSPPRPARPAVTAQVHLKIDTGLSPQRRAADGWPELVAWARD